MSKVVWRYFSVGDVDDDSRLLLAYGGEEFEGARVAPTNWPEYTPKTVYAQKQKQYSQSFHIARFLGQQHGLAGDYKWETSEIDKNIDFLVGIRLKAAAIYYETDETIKAIKQENAVKNVYPELLEKLNSIVVKNNGHIAARKLTWGDFLFTGSFDYFKTLLQMPDLEEEYPAFQQLMDNVYSIPRVKAFLDADNTVEFPER